MAFETDLLEYDDLFDGNPAVDAKVNALKEGARHELANLDSMGAISSIEYMKSRLVDSNAERLNRIERNETVVVGVNKFTTGEPSPLMSGDGGIMVVDPAVEEDQISRLNRWRASRDEAAVAKALTDLRKAAAEGQNVMAPSIAAAKAGVTTGEWAHRCAPFLANIADRRAYHALCPTRPKGLMTFARQWMRLVINLGGV